jgi:molecular chaperone GrpE
MAQTETSKEVIAGGDPEKVAKPKVFDKRRVGKAGASAKDPSIKPAYVQQLEEKVSRAERLFREKVATLQEETERSRQRLKVDLEKRFEEREISMLLDVLAILDDLERARGMASSDPRICEGLALVSSRARKFLAKHGCEQLSPLGEQFNPETMEAIAVAPGVKDTVVMVHQPGYQKGGSLLRPARVVVGSGEPEAEA